MHRHRRCRARRPPRRSWRPARRCRRTRALTRPGPARPSRVTSALSHRGASLPLGERGGQARGQPVVGELRRRLARRPATAIRPRRAGSDEQLVERAGHRVDVVGLLDDQPRLAVDAPPRPPRRCRRRPGARRPRPPRGTRCRSPPARGPPSGCGRAWRRRRRSRRSAGRSSWLHAAEQPHGRAGRLDRAARAARRSRPPPPMATVRSGWRGASARGGLDEHVHPLARHRAGSGSRRAARRPAARSAARAAARSSSSSGRKRSVSTPGGTSTLGSGRPGGALALGQRVAAGRDHQAGASEHVAQHEVRAGQAAGHGDLGAVEHDGVRVARAGARPGRRAGPGRAPRSVGADLVGRARRSRRTSDGVGRSTFSRGPHDPEGLRRRPTRASPS